MSKQIVSSVHAPAAIGPYSQAVIFGRLIYCSGQIGLDPGSGELAGDGTSEQMRQVMKNINELLSTANSNWEKVLKCTIYLLDMDDFSEVNKIYAGFFPEKPPAREVVAVKSLPKNARVKISCTAHR